MIVPSSKAFFNAESSEEYPGEIIYRDFLKRKNLEFSFDAINSYIETSDNCHSLKEFFSQVEVREIDLEKFANSQDLTPKKGIFLSLFHKKKEPESSLGKIHFPDCCYPVKDDRVICIKDNEDHFVHRVECKKFRESSSSKITTFNWNTIQNKKFESQIVLSLKNGTGVLNGVFHVVADLKINIINVRSEIKHSIYGECSMVVEVSDKDELSNLLEHLTLLDSVHNVIRYLET